MSDLSSTFLPLLIALLDFGVMLGFPFSTMLRFVGRWWLLLFAIGVIAPMILALLYHLHENSPQSLSELGTWLGFAFGVFLVFLRIIFGAGAVGRLFERRVASAVYDVLSRLVEPSCGVIGGLEGGSSICSSKSRYLGIKKNDGAH